MIVAIAWAALLMTLGVLSLPFAIMSVVLAGVCIALAEALT
jgi:hypothetical protein